MSLGNCKYCGIKLRPSDHVSANERAKRDADKEFCNGQCAAAYKAQTAETKNGVVAMDQFLYAGLRR